MLRRCSRLHASQVQTCWPFSTPSTQVRRADKGSSGIRPQLVQTSCAFSCIIGQVSTHRRPTRPAPAAGNLGDVATRLIEPAAPRLLLRQWSDDDRTPFAALNADPSVMEHFPGALTRDQSDAMVDRCTEQIQRDGYGLWAVEVRTNGEFIGFVGLAVPRWEATFTPCTEIGWRLARRAWGHGYATEAANAVLATAFGEIGLDDLVSFTTIDNQRSQQVMQRIRMTRDPTEDFDHPRVTAGPLRRHVLYRINRAEWERRDRDHPRPHRP